MASLNAGKLDQILDRFSALEAEMATGEASGEDFVRMSKEYADLEPVAKSVTELRAVEQEIADLNEVVEANEDAELVEMAQSELRDLKSTLSEYEGKVAIMLLPKDAADERNVILEVRAGTGGDEAALFAGHLFRMYQRYAAIRGWKVEIMSANESGVGGYKEIVANISGAGPYAALKFESGVHRVQRVPETETQGRIHTSAATVAVLPEAEEVDVQIEAKDLRIDVFRASGPGGQSVNTTDSAVRIVHLPTNTTVIQQDEKSQLKNKEKAMKVLKARLFEQERLRIADERSEARRGQVGSGDRSERIRTYNFPQGRVTDHRINLTLYKLDQVMEGAGLQELIDALTNEHQAALLAQENLDLA